jgi:hypothetical protein
MPVLRQPADNTLAETLGNLGSSLSSALNPMNAIRSQNMMSEIQARQWELQQKQSIDAANRNAANVFYNSDLPIDAATREITAAGLRSGSLSVNNYIDALKATGGLKAAQTASAMYAAAHPELPAEELASDQAELLAGRKTASELTAQHATTKLTTAKTDRALEASNAARAAVSSGAPSELGSLAASEALTDPATAEKMVAGGRVRGVTGPLTQTQIDQLQADREAAGYSRTPLGTAPTAGSQPQADAEAAARAGEFKRQERVGEMIAAGIPPSGNIFPQGLPGSKTNRIGAPLPEPGAYPPSPLGGAAPPVPASTQNVVIPNQESPSATPTPVVRSVATPDMPNAVVAGESTPEATQRTEVDKNVRAQLQEAVDAGNAGIKMLALLDRLNTLNDIANIATGSGQLPGWALTKLREYHIVATNRAGILAEMQSLFNAQIPELRKDMGVKFEAGPELSAQGKMIGDPSLPAQVLKGIFARQAVIAQLSVDRRNLAQRALYAGQPNPLSTADYFKEEAKIWDNLTAAQQKAIEASGGYTRENQSPPPAPAALSSGSAMDAIRALLRHLGGAGDQPAPVQTQQTPPNATEVWDVDKNGHPIRVPAR